MNTKFDRLLEEANRYVLKGDWKGAFENLAKAHELQPNDVGVLTGIAQCALQLGRKAETLTFLEQAILLAPDSSDAHNNLGVIQAMMGMREESEGSYQMATTLDPDNSQAWKNLAMLYLGIDERAGEGVQILYAVAQSNPSDSDAWFLLGQCYEEIGDLDSAKTLYEYALKYSADHALAKQALEKLPQAESTSKLSTAPDFVRIARPEHARKLAGLKDLIKKNNGGTSGENKEPTPDGSHHIKAISCYGPADMLAEVRMSAPARALMKAGMQVKLSLHLNAHDLDTQDIFIFANPHFSEELLQAAEKSIQCAEKRTDVQVVIDLDRDFYNLPPEHPAYQKVGKGNPKSLQQLEELLKKVNLVTVPSANLARVYTPFATKVEIVPYSWSRADILWEKPSPKRKTINLGVAGLHTTPQDVSILAENVQQIFSEYENTLLVIGGDMLLSDAFRKISDDRKMFTPMGLVKDYPYLFADFDILLIPLLPSEYNQSLSDLPLLEAGLRSIPWVATEIPAFLDWGVGGTLVNQKNDWYTSIQQLVEKVDLRIKLGKEGRQKAETREADHVVSRWKEVLSV